MPVECPKCHETNDDESVVCTFCGGPLVISPMPSDNVELMHGGGKVVSPRSCVKHPDANVDLEGDRLVCSECGCDLGGLESDRNTSQIEEQPAIILPDQSEDLSETVGKVAFLEVEGGQEIFFRGAYTTKVPLKASSVLVGRRDVMASHYPDIDLMMYRKLDPAISRRHLRFFLEEGDYFIEDLCNNNATFLNDYANKLNHERRKLHHGDRIFVSMSLAFLFRLQD